MKYIHAATIGGGQDGSIYGDLLFRFDADGSGRVFCLDGVTADRAEPLGLAPVAEFRLGGADRVIPHCNSVVFGAERWEEGDEFPLLYANVYNNYGKIYKTKTGDRLEGTACVYRVRRDGVSFAADLVQLLRIGFVEDRSLWKSFDSDIRPYGNFVVDAENRKLHAFVMRDAEQVTRFFAFELPGAHDGVFDAEFGVPVVTLTPADILYHYDASYMRYLQGACCRNGKIWSCEGGNPEDPSAIRVIDTDLRAEVLFDNAAARGMPMEAEFIDFWGDTLIYSDAKGVLYFVKP